MGIKFYLPSSPSVRSSKENKHSFYKVEIAIPHLSAVLSIHIGLNLSFHFFLVVPVLQSSCHPLTQNPGCINQSPF